MRVLKFAAAVLLSQGLLSIHPFAGAQSIPIQGDFAAKLVRIHQPRAIKDLEARAHTREDFERLASLWESEATGYTQKAVEHEEEADDYATRRRFEPKTGIPGGLLNHCRQFAKLSRQRSRSASAAASIDHDKANAVGGAKPTLNLGHGPEVGSV